MTEGIRVEIDRHSGTLGEEVGYRAGDVFLSDADEPVMRRLCIGRVTVHYLTAEELDALEAVVLARRERRVGDPV